MGPTSEMPIITQNICGGCLCTFTPLGRAHIQPVQHAADKHLPVDLDMCVCVYFNMTVTVRS